MKLSVYNSTGEDSGKKVDLPKDIFGIEPNDHAIYLDVKRYLTHQRQGTSKSKERNEVKGSRRKIKRQKGTGTARAGDIKNPLFRGGGTVFGPRPHKPTLRLNKKVKQLARKSAFTYKAQEEKIKILSGIEMAEPKTKAFAEVLNNLDLSYEKTLILVNENDENLFKASRNLPFTHVKVASDVSTYEVLNAETLVLTPESIEQLKTVLS